MPEKKSSPQSDPSGEPGKTLLIADDEPNIRRVLQAIFTKDGYTVHIAEDGRRALAIAQNTPIHVLITDLIMPDMNGIELLQKIKQKQPEVIAVMITAYATIKTCVDAMRYGASDYITKPFDVDEMRAVVKRVVAQASTAPELGDSKPNHGGQKPSASLFAKASSLAMQVVETMVTRAATSRANVLIRGESGTGKEVTARALHAQSERASRPFVAVSCAALPEALLESELFGHEKNAFTGAATERKGRFEMAHGGTLFLDEIGEISPAVQVKLLRVLQQREFERVGGTKTLKVDVRVIAATNAALEQRVKENQFREDLYYRLRVIEIPLPPLRERAEDIPVLAQQFLERFNKENGRQITVISSEALMLLQTYSWPGNIRELENAIERAVVLSDKDESTLILDLLPLEVRTNLSPLA